MERFVKGLVAGIATLGISWLIYQLSVIFGIIIPVIVILIIVAYAVYIKKYH